MAAMTTVLSEFRDSGDERTYALATHSIARPRLVLQRRKVAAGSAGSLSEDQVSVLFGTEDSEGNPLKSRILLTATLRRPFDGADADVDAALALFREIVASTNFEDVMDKQAWLS